MAKVRSFRTGDGNDGAAAGGVPVPAFRSGRDLARKESQIEGRDIRKINVGLIDPNPYAPRESYTPEMIEARASALRDQGQHDAIHVIPNPDVAGRYIIADGWTRTLACTQHQVLEYLLAEVHHDLSANEAAWFGYQQNEERVQHCDLDRGFFYKKMMDAGQTLTQIAEFAKVSKSQMSYYLSFTKLPDDVLDIVRAHPAKFGANAAHHLSRMAEAAGIKKTVALAQQFVDEDKTIAWLNNHVQTYTHPDLTPEKKTRAAWGREFKFGSGHYREREGRFEMVVDVDPERGDEFSAALENLLHAYAKKKD